MQVSPPYSSKRNGRLKRRLYRILLTSRALFDITLIAFVLYFFSAIQTPVPEVSDKTAWDWKREHPSDSVWTVKGNWLRKSETGLWEVYLEGKPFERGAAYGNLCQELLYKQEVAFINQLKRMIPDEKYIKFLKYFIGWFNRDLENYVPEEYKLEIYGESVFGPDSFQFVTDNYPRMLNYHAAHDIGHALVNANLVGCTSFAVKDAQSEDGSLWIGRNFDFNLGEEFAAQKMVVMINPDSGFKHVFVSWPGFLGVVSGMNEKGLTVTLNAAPTGLPFSAKAPISIVAREILQYASNFEEAKAIANAHETFVAELILIGSAEDNGTLVIEKSPEATHYYEQEGARLTCSNHYLSKEKKDSEENQKQFLKTSSLKRYTRVNQLLDQAGKLNASKVAAVLRDQKGIDDTDIGMGNENAMNQLYAHHGVIFQPSERKIWISCNPYQLGRFVCYDLDEIFSGRSTEPVYAHEIYDSAASVPADSFLYSSAYGKYEQFIRIRDEIQLEMKKGITSPSFSVLQLDAFIALNPNFYLGYALSGEYLLLTGHKTDAKPYLEKALQLDIPLETERKKIEKQVEKCSR